MRRASALSTALVCLATAACGDDSNVRSATAPAVPSKDLATAFAPLVRLDRRERALPASASHLLANSGLEWGRADRCGFGRDVTPSATLAPGESSPLPPLVPARLGRQPGYKAYALRPDCEPKRDVAYSTAQHTRPFDRENRPAGLRIDEGFNLDIVSAVLYGRRRLARDGSLAAVPAYYALANAGTAARPGIQVSYWLAFGAQQQPDPGGESREGDWERIDVLTRPGRRRGLYVPMAVEYHHDNGRSRRVPWSATPLDGPGGTHPVAYLDRGMHTPRPGRTCRSCTDWKTWNRLREVRREPWYGYGGGWGAIGDSDEESGPAGPSPFELGQAP
jgi:hypothetical protein